MGYTTLKEEREITISLSDADKDVSAYVSSPRWMKKLDALCEEQPDTFKCTQTDYIEGDVVAKWYTFPGSQLSIRRKSNMSEESRKNAGERLLNARMEKRKEKGTENG